MRLFDNLNYDCYSPAFFHIQMANSLPGSKMVGSKYESELFHEYLHFLQDTTTTFGVTNSKIVFKKIWNTILVVQKNKNQTFSLPFNGNRFHDPIIRDNYENFKIYLQYTNTELLKSNIIYKIEENKTNTLDYDTYNFLDIYFYTVCFSNNFSCNFGAHAIQEGICHLLQKEVYGIQPSKLQLPYDLSYSIWCQYLPDEKNNLAAFLDLSEASLMFFNPAEIFITTIQAIKDGRFKADKMLYTNIVY